MEYRIEGAQRPSEDMPRKRSGRLERFCWGSTLNRRKGRTKGAALPSARLGDPTSHDGASYRLRCPKSLGDLALRRSRCHTWKQSF